MLIVLVMLIVSIFSYIILYTMYNSFKTVPLNGISLTITKIAKMSLPEKHLEIANII